MDKDSDEYMKFYANRFQHCPMNHKGSAASIKSEDVYIYEQSEPPRKVRYNPYVGDGNHKALLSILN